MKNKNIETDKATPRPWVFEKVQISIGYCFKIGSAEQVKTPHGPICIYGDRTSLNPRKEGQAEADAQLICDAVNERELVLAVVEAAKGVLEAVGASQHESITGVLGMGKAVAALDAYRAQKEKK